MLNPDRSTQAEPADTEPQTKDRGLIIPNLTRHEPLISDFSRFTGMRIGVLGGTFDPPHLAHIAIGALIKSHYNLDALIYVPTPQNQKKDHAPKTSAEDRVGMLRAALRVSPDCYVSDLAAHDARFGYTVDLLNAIHEQTGENIKIYWIGGSDNLIDAAPGKHTSLPYWKETNRIFELATFVVTGRGNWATEGLPALDPALYTPDQIAQLTQNFVPFSSPLSATEVRAKLAAGQIPHEMLPPGVAEYIAEHNLYGCSGN